MSKSKRKRKSAPGPKPRLLNSPPEGKRRVLVEVFIWSVLAVNVLIPLRWYLAPVVNVEVDERFTWRMFSAYSMRRTQISLHEEIEVNGKTVERQIELSTILQPSWAELLSVYHQPSLVEYVLSEHCRQTGALRATFTRTGTWSDGTPIVPTVIRVERGGGR